MRSDFSQVQTGQRLQMDPSAWRLYSADTSEADVLRLAAKALDVPEERVEVKQTGGGWLAREKQEKSE